MQFVRIETSGGVSTISLNRPEKLNALNDQVMSEIGQALDQVSGDTTRVVILRGEGRNFAAGADVAAVSQIESSAKAYAFAQKAGTIYDRLYSFPKPVVASIDGYALGGGCELVLACDLRIASEEAKLGLPEVTLGLLPGGGGIQRLIRQIGFVRAKDLLFTGRIISATEALNLGLVNQVVPREALAAETAELAQRLAGLPSLSLSQIKAAANKGLETDLGSALEIERQAFAILFSTGDTREGMRAFLEKRKPDFQGC